MTPQQTNTSADLHDNHWTISCYTQIVSTKEYQEILDRHGSWVILAGKEALIKGKKIGPDRYEVWLETEK